MTIIILFYPPNCIAAMPVNESIDRIVWQYDDNKIWDTDQLVKYYEKDSLTTGCITCSHPVRFISGKIPADGQLSFSWKKGINSDDSNFLFYRNDNFTDACSYIEWSPLNSYNVKRDDTVKWVFRLDSPPCSQGQGWLFINYTEDQSPAFVHPFSTPALPTKGNLTYRTPKSLVQFDAITPIHICKNEDFHIYVKVESTKHVYKTSGLKIEYSNGLNILDLSGEGFLKNIKLNNTRNEYESSASIPSTIGRIDIIYNISNNTENNTYFISFIGLSLETADDKISVSDKKIIMEIPDKFTSEMRESYKIKNPSHKENIECLNDCYFN